MPEENPESFENYVFKEISYRDEDLSGNILRNDKVSVVGSAKIDIEEESLDGVKIILKKDESENIKEIKFVCSCGQTKSVVLDYSEE